MNHPCLVSVLFIISSFSWKLFPLGKSHSIITETVIQQFDVKRKRFNACVMFTSIKFLTDLLCNITWKLAHFLNDIALFSRHFSGPVCCIQGRCVAFRASVLHTLLWGKVFNYHLQPRKFKLVKYFFDN